MCVLSKAEEKEKLSRSGEGRPVLIERTMASVTPAITFLYHDVPFIPYVVTGSLSHWVEERFTVSQ